MSWKGVASTDALRRHEEVYGNSHRRSRIPSAGVRVFGVPVIRRRYEIRTAVPAMVRRISSFHRALLRRELGTFFVLDSKLIPGRALLRRVTKRGCILCTPFDAAAIIN
jgi:hypothetical protein